MIRLVGYLLLRPQGARGTCSPRGRLAMIDEMPRSKESQVIENDRKRRITDELTRAGGEKVLNELSFSDREMWNRQAVLLSYLRESGDVEHAALSAGVSVVEEAEWFEDKVLSYDLRRAHALRSLARQLERLTIDTVTAQLNQKKIPNPRLWLEIMARLDPARWDPEKVKDDPAGAKAMQAVRDLQAKYNALEQDVEARVEERLKEELSKMAVQEAEDLLRQPPSAE